MAAKSGWKNLWPKHNVWPGVKGHAGGLAGLLDVNLYGYQIWSEESFTRAYCIAGARGHAEVMVNKLLKCLEIPYGYRCHRPYIVGLGS